MNWDLLFSFGGLLDVYMHTIKHCFSNRSILQYIIIGFIKSFTLAHCAFSLYACGCSSYCILSYLGKFSITSCFHTVSQTNMSFRPVPVCLFLKVRYRVSYVLYTFVSF